MRPCLGPAASSLVWAPGCGGGAIDSAAGLVL